MEEVMSESMEREVEIRNKYGLHARPATQFVEMANQYPCEVVLVKDGEEVNGKSVMGLMMLGAECGARFRIRCTGESAAECVEKLAGLVDSKFGEE